MSISAQDVKKLRDMTGAGMMDCKEALTATNNNFDEAVDFLRKKGVARAAKKADRATNEGLVVALVREGGKVGSMVLVNCETDFVARTEEFVQLVDNLVRHVDQKAPNFLRREDAEAAGAPAAQALHEQDFLAEPGKTVGTVLAEKIGKIGENMQIGRFVRFAAPENGLIQRYIHPGSRVGVLIEMIADKAAALETAPVKALIHDLSMQVAAAMPRAVCRADVPTEQVEKEREIARDQLKEEKKPPQVIEKIIDGKINKFFGETCLVEQLFIKDQETKIQDLVAKVGKEVGAELKITRFSRFALGEA